MHKKILPIRGMHCRSCEVLISEALKEIPGVKNVNIKYKDEEATVYSEQEIPTSVLSGAVAKAGYEVGINDSNSWISLNSLDYKHFAVGLIIFIALYLIAKSTGLFNLNTSGSGNPSSLGVVLLVGLTAGVSTCMALVGGLVLGISARHKEKHPEATPFQNFRPHLFFNLGRILSYFILGGVIGLAGKAFQLSGSTLGIMTIIVGLIMVLLGIQISGLFPKVSSGGISLPSGISRFLGLKRHNAKEYSHTNSALIGALTFFLPCGFTQAMQLYAISTGSFISGALIMGIFAIGTAPGLLGIGGLTAVIKGRASSIFFKFVAITLIAMAIFNLNNGFNLTGWKLGSERQGKATLDDPNVKIENGVQIVSMTQTSGGYKPNKFTIKKALPVKWVIDAKNPNSCSGSILMPKYNIKKTLKTGQNIIEFIPKEAGEVKFSCSMGMYTGKFIIVEEGKTVSATENKSESDQPKAAGCCGSQSKKAATPSSETASASDVTPSQDIKTTYLSLEDDISPSKFTAPADKPVRFEIDVKADGAGCMETIMIPGIIDEPVFLQKGKTIVWNFTAKPGTYEITCAMGVPRGEIKIV